MKGVNWPIVGHEKIISFLLNEIATSSISSAYLFLGPPSLGKYTTALYFAKTLLCLKSQEGNYCEDCPSCREFEKNIHPDLLLINKNENGYLSIETVREMRRKIGLLPSLSKKKVAIFEEASQLTQEAQNALLKILEEPPEYLIFVLVSASGDLLPTIISRCRILSFPPLPFQLISQELKRRGYSEKEGQFLASFSQGQIGLVLENGPSLLKDWPAKISEISRLKEASLSEKMDFLKKMDPSFLNFWLSLFENVLLRKLGIKKGVFEEKIEKDLEDLASFYSLSQISQILSNIQKSQTLFSQNVNKRLILENLALYI